MLTEKIVRYVYRHHNDVKALEYLYSLKKSEWHYEANFSIDTSHRVLAQTIVRECSLALRFLYECRTK